MSSANESFQSLSTCDTLRDALYYSRTIKVRVPIKIYLFASSPVAQTWERTVRPGHYGHKKHFGATDVRPSDGLFSLFWCVYDWQRWRVNMGKIWEVHYRHFKSIYRSIFYTRLLLPSTLLGFQLSKGKDPLDKLPDHCSLSHLSKYEVLQSVMQNHNTILNERYLFAVKLHLCTYKNITNKSYNYASILHMYSYFPSK